MSAFQNLFESTGDLKCEYGWYRGCVNKYMASGISTRDGAVPLPNYLGSVDCLRPGSVIWKSCSPTTKTAPDISHQLENTMQCMRTPNITTIHTYRFILSHLVWEAGL